MRKQLKLDEKLRKKNDLEAVLKSEDEEEEEKQKTKKEAEEEEKMKLPAIKVWSEEEKKKMQ